MTTASDNEEEGVESPEFDAAFNEDEGKAAAAGSDEKHKKSDNADNADGKKQDAADQNGDGGAAAGDGDGSGDPRDRLKNRFGDGDAGKKQDDGKKPEGEGRDGDAGGKKEEAGGKEAGGKDASGGGKADSVADFIKEYGLGDQKITVYDDDNKPSEIPMSQMAEQYPELMQSTVAIAQAVAKKERAAIGNLSKLPDMVREMAIELENMKFWNKLTDPNGGGIPDARQIVNSKEFEEWLPKQPEYVRKAISSPRVEDAKDVIVAFKNDMAAAGAKSHDDQVGKKRAFQKAMVKSDKGASTDKKPSVEDEFEEEFNK